MVWWILWLALLTILSYLTDVGVISFMQVWRIPVLNASPLSLLILLATAGLLVRTLWMRRRGEKEKMVKRIEDLEKKLDVLSLEKK